MALRSHEPQLLCTISLDRFTSSMIKRKITFKFVILIGNAIVCFSDYIAVEARV